ncbi:hypothetical protein HDU92_008482 [Lobulomyces angularis]|nr:hypothetical protein HDU92_008482 [Lobulomyces angularis]
MHDTLLEKIISALPTSPSNLYPKTLVEKTLGFSDEFPLTEEEIQNSVIEWIYATNKLEFSGAETIVDTKKILRALMKTQSNVEKEVLQTAELLSTTYDRSSGKLRKSDVYASNIDKSLYYFPHHGLIKDHLFSLGKLVFYILKTLSRDILGETPLLYTFALACFTQFHFLELHHLRMVMGEFVDSSRKGF